ncbi:MAG: cell division/cell wall cluster transcriptional repressor MraZ [Acetobacteraceae bacterium]|nr:cell division/cell wall cluster transcriptional repressor MraZ [Acetobacteraceae bacterium]
MTQFRGKITSRLDAKGRVSVPADFRKVLAGDAIVLRRSTRHLCLEAWPAAAFDADLPAPGPLDQLSPEDEAIALAMFADTTDVTPDPEGRVVLPRDLREFAGITDSVTFMGVRSHFQIWAPAAADAQIEAARAALARAQAARQAGGAA